MFASNPILKAVHYLVVSLLAGGFAAPLLDGRGPNAVTAVAAAGALAVWLTKNTPRQPWARTVTSLYVAAVAVLTAAFTDQHITSLEWQQIILALLGGTTVLSSSDEHGPVTPG